MKKLKIELEDELYFLLIRLCEKKHWKINGIINYLLSSIINFSNDTEENIFFLNEKIKKHFQKIKDWFES